jgi:hypothetical protein
MRTASPCNKLKCHFSARQARLVLMLALPALLVGALILHRTKAAGSAGDLDTTFDSDGKVTTDFFGNEDVAQAMTIQPNGKFVAAGVRLGL